MIQLIVAQPPFTARSTARVSWGPANQKRRSPRRTVSFVEPPVCRVDRSAGSSKL